MESIFQTLYLFFSLISIRAPWNSVEGITYFPFSYFHGGGGWIPTLFPSRAKYGWIHPSFHLPLPHFSPGQEEDLTDPADQWLSEKTKLDHPPPEKVCYCVLSAVVHWVTSATSSSPALSVVKMTFWPPAVWHLLLVSVLKAGGAESVYWSSKMPTVVAVIIIPIFKVGK